MDIRGLRARDIMKTDVIKAHPDMTIADLARLLQEKHITGVPVVDRTNRLVGVVSQTDIIRFYATYPRNSKDVHPYFKGDVKDRKLEEPAAAAADFGDRKVEEIMTQETFAFNEMANVTEIAVEMIRLHMHRVIIVDEDMSLSGVITTMDFVRLISQL